MVGDMEEKRRAPGRIELGRSGRGSYQFIAPFSMKPVPGGMTPEGTPRVWVSETTVPSASQQETVVVSRASPATRVSRALSPRRIAAAHAWQDRIDEGRLNAP